MMELEKGCLAVMENKLHWQHQPKNIFMAFCEAKPTLELMLHLESKKAGVVVHSQTAILLLVTSCASMLVVPD